jgi:predicted dehydrogenase
MRGGSHKPTLLDRRQFLKLSALAAVGAAAGRLAADPSPSRSPRRDQDLRMVVIGVHGQGRSHLSQIERAKGARVVGVCDVDRDLLDAQVKSFADKGETIFVTQDMREVFDRSDVDAVSIATPNHWHALATIWACQAGKHVYVEKPVSHNVWEGRKMVEAARKHGSIVQAGLQNRSDTGMRPLSEWLRDEPLGKVKYAHAFWLRVRKPIGRVSGPTPIPEQIDYNLFCGPRDVGPLMRKSLHYDWHWQWPYGNGELGNTGPHVLDDARWLLGLGLPRRIMNVGDRFVWDDDGQTPNVSFAVLEFERFPVVFEVRDLPVRTGSRDAVSVRGRGAAVLVVCENGYALGWRGGAKAFDGAGNEIKSYDGDGGATHMQNFIDAVRSGKREDQRCDIEEGHRTSLLCHVANITYRLGSREPMEKIRDAIGEAAPALEPFDTIPPYLEANGVDLEATPMKMGAWMTLDRERERFLDGPNLEQANAMLRESYRSPFVVPDNV